MQKREQEVLLEKIKSQAELFWENPEARPFLQAEQTVDPALIEDAARRLERFAPFLAKAFPETAAQQGIIESALREIPEMGQSLSCPGKLMLKMDSHLPISGSVKARGGIYEVLRHAEDLAVQAGKLQMEDDYAVLAEPEFRAFFEQFCVQVGSTGNLGMSIGIMSAALGFQTIVHMSADAKEWKKQLLRQHGVQVLEYAGDYSQAVAQGRKNSDADPHSYFVDDEHSLDLFLGYAVAAQRLKAQLEAQGIQISRERPLFVYLPCGVGGAPGGICYGLKQIFGDAVSCFFVEPAATPCMLLGLATEKWSRQISAIMAFRAKPTQMGWQSAGLPGWSAGRCGSWFRASLPCRMRSFMTTCACSARRSIFCWSRLPVQALPARAASRRRRLQSKLGAPCILPGPQAAAWCRRRSWSSICIRSYKVMSGIPESRECRSFYFGRKLDD